jgi:hypothetical protein
MAHLPKPFRKLMKRNRHTVYVYSFSNRIPVGIVRTLEKADKLAWGLVEKGYPEVSDVDIIAKKSWDYN